MPTKMLPIRQDPSDRSRGGLLHFSSDEIQIYPSLCDGSPDLTNPLITRELALTSSTRTGGATISITNGCNLACVYCPYGQEAMRDRRQTDSIQTMSPSVACAIVDYLLAAFGTSVDVISLSFTSAGEPSLNLPVILAVVEYCRDKEKIPSTPRFSFNFTTNCSALSDSDIKQLAITPGMDMIFSVDGPRDIHNQLRTQPGDESNYDTLRHCLEVYKREKRDSKGIISSTVLTAKYNCFDQILCHLESIGFNHIAMRPIRGMTKTSFGLTEDTLPLFLSGYGRLVSLLENKITSGDISLLTKINNRYDLFGRLLRAVLFREPRSQGCPRCPSVYEDVAQYSLVFDVHGDVYFPCRDFIGLAGSRVGNIYAQVDTNRVRQVLNRLDVHIRPVCKSCWVRSLCGGHCYSAALLSSGKIEEPDRNLCKLTRYLAIRAIRLAARLAGTGLGPFE